MSAQDRAIQKLARELAGIKKEVVSWRGPQADYTSIENGGNFTFKDGDGNVTAVVGGQDDGSNTIRHVDGPTPPIPSGLSAHVDGPIVQVSWDGTFESDVTHDWHYLEVLAVGPSNEQLTGTINDLNGGETSLAATAQGDWFITARSVSRAGKRSLDGDAGTVAVELVGLTGAIEAVQESADGKNTIYYSATMPPGVDYTTGDLWFDTSEAGQNEVHVWDGGLWMSLADARVDVLEAAQVSLDTAMSELDGRLGTVESDLPQQIADAKQAAIDAAALDATDKADAAQLAAEAKAATAQQAADNALAAINAGDSMWADPGFESGNGPFASLRPEATRSTEFAYQGAWSMKIATDGDAGNQYPEMVYADVTPGRTYRLSVAVRSEDSITFESWFHEYDNETLVGAVPYLQIPTTPGSWHLGNVIRTVPSGVNRFRFIPMIRDVDNTVAGRALFMDNFTLTDITDGYEQYLEALQAAQDAQTVAGEAKAIAEAAVGAAEGGNTNFFSTSEPAGVGSLVGDRWFKRDAAWAITGLWMWDGSAWVKQTLNNEVIGNLDAGKITFGKMSGELIDVGTIYADRIVSGVSQNMVPDPGFSNATISAHRIAKANTYGAIVTIADGVLGIDATPGITASSNVSLAATDDLYAWGAYPAMRVAARVSARGVGGFRLNMRYKKRDGSTVYTTLNPTSYTPLTATWTDYSYTYDLPQEAVGFSVVIQLQASSSGLCEFRSPLVAAQVGSTVIENGSVTTGKLQADVLNVSNLKAGTAAINEAVVNKLFAEAVVAKMVTADEFIGENAIITGSITTPKLAVGAITAESGIIESLDLGTATVGELDGVRIMGQTIRGEQLSGDAIDGKVITGPIIQSAREGQRWVGDTTGIRIFNADNEVRTQLSPDDSVFKGEVEADTLVVNGGAEFKENNTLAQGASLLLAAGVTDPTAPPTVQPYWDSLDFESPHNVPLVGLAFDGTNYWSASPAHQWPYDGGIAQAIRVDATTGEVQSFRPPATNRTEYFGVTCIGSELFWLYRTGYKAFVLVTDLDCVKKREWEYPGLAYTSSNPLTYKPGIGNDGTNIVIAQCDDDGPLNIRTYNKTTGALISAAKDTGDGTKSDITGVYVGNADWGRKLVTVAKQSGGKLPSFSATTGVYDGGATQFNAATLDSTGVVFVDGKFRTLDPSGMIHEYADVTTGDNSSDWWAAYRWYTDVNDDDIIGATDYTSRISPGARFTWPSRAMVRVIGQPLPDGAGSLGPYLAKKSTVPVRTDYHAPSWWPTVGRPVAEWRALSTDWGTKPVPDDTNTYPEGTSSVLESASGTFRLQGDGSGYWGPLKMGRNGVMSGLVVSGSLNITPDEANVTKKVTLTLPAGRFANPPVVWAQASTTTPQNVDVSVALWEVTATGFNVYLNRNTATSTNVVWFAMDSE